MFMKYYLIPFIALLTVFIIFISPLFGQGGLGGVGNISLINVTPKSFSWNNISVASLGDVNNMTIENIGTINISTIYATITTTNTNPYGTGISTNYNAGNFILLRNNTNTSTSMFYIKNKNFNETPPVYLALPANQVSRGRFRFNNGDVFWSVASGSANNCTNGTIRIGSAIHNSTAVGDVDLTGASALTLSPVNSAKWGAVDATIVGYQYCVFVSDNCTETVISRWNKGEVPYDDSNICNNDVYITSGNLPIGENITVQIAISVPYGVASGNLTSGTITVVSSE